MCLARATCRWATAPPPWSCWPPSSSRSARRLWRRACTRRWAARRRLGLQGAAEPRRGLAEPNKMFYPKEVAVWKAAPSPERRPLPRVAALPRRPATRRPSSARSARRRSWRWGACASWPRTSAARTARSARRCWRSARRRASTPSWCAAAAWVALLGRSAGIGARPAALSNRLVAHCAGRQLPGAPGCVSPASLCAATPPHPLWPGQVSGERDFFARMVVQAVSTLNPESLDLRMLGIKKVQVSRGQQSQF